MNGLSISGKEVHELEEIRKLENEVEAAKTKRIELLKDIETLHIKRWEASKLDPDPTKIHYPVEGMYTCVISNVRVSLVGVRGQELDRVGRVTKVSRFNQTNEEPISHHIDLKS